MMVVLNFVGVFFFFFGIFFVAEMRKVSPKFLSGPNENVKPDVGSSQNMGG